MSDTISAEGVIEWMRSADRPDRPQCICCEGPHVFAHSLVLDGWGKSAVGWLWDAVRQMPEGARIRITLEEVAPPPARSPRPDTGGRPVSVTLPRMSDRLSPYSDMHVERVRAHAKHDTNGDSMERKTWDDPAWLPVVVEEVGEVARVLCDQRHMGDYAVGVKPTLREELVQVGAMVAAWISAIDAAASDG